MRRVTVSELKNRLSEFLRLVKRGEEIEVLERSRPIARIEAIRPRGGDSEEELERLARAGVIRRARRPPEPDDLPEPLTLSAGDIVQAVVEERGDR